jgi:tyrosyl-tRNA synthetase
MTEHDAKKTGAEVVKQGDNAPFNAPLSGLIYPLMQTLDEEHLGMDEPCGGLDQRSIFMYSRAGDIAHNWIQGARPFDEPHGSRPAWRKDVCF